MSGQPGPNWCVTLVREMQNSFHRHGKGVSVCGPSDDQRAVVLGRTGGKYEIASILSQP